MASQQAQGDKFPISVLSLQNLPELAPRPYYMPYMTTAMIWQTLSTSSAETERLGRLLGRKLSGGEVIELRSDLGGGKTTFTRGIVQGAGSRANVTSPTFTLSRIYSTKKFKIYHFDFYRLNTPGILADQLAESISANNAVVIVEWADIVKDTLPEERISIELKPTVDSPDERQITMTYAEKYHGLVNSVATDWMEIEP
jgi:tRNA threonylcarbamoyladenosine biosynthesis protein TsaE